MDHLRRSIHPGLRGALFYSAYWGVVGMYEPFINIYYLNLGLTGEQIGWLAAVLPLCVMIVTPLVARLADITHRRVLFLAAGCLGYGLALTLFVTAGARPTFPTLIAIIALISVFRGPIISLADSLIAPMAVRHDLNFGAMRLWGSIIFTAAAFGLGLLWERAGLSAMFLVSAVGFLPVALTALLLDENRPATQSVQAQSSALNKDPKGFAGQNRPVLAEQIGPTSAASGSKPSGSSPTPARRAGSSLAQVNPGLWFLLAATFLVIAALFMSGNFATVYMRQMGGSAMLVGMVLGMSALFEVPGMLWGRAFARRFGSTNMLLLAYGLAALGMFGYGISQSPGVLLAFSGVRGLGFGLMLVGNVTIINHHAPGDATATFMGVFNAAVAGLAPLLGGPISGWVYQSYGPPALFFLTAALTLAAGLVILPTYRIWGKN